MVENRTVDFLRRVAPGTLVSSLFVGATLLVAQSGTAIPEYSRRYDVACAMCHVHPPKLNELGFLFAAMGPEGVGLEDRGPATSLWLSTFAGKTGSDDILGVPNRAELISLGSIAPSLIYFAAWRLLSKERLSDGSVRDRSGRFEDLYLIWHAAYASVMFGPIANPFKLALEARARDGSRPTFSLELSYYR